jgi:pantetheine-phosphate adenylyltransferase
MIESYEKRVSEVSAFISRVRPSISCTFMPLIDPEEPTRAETEPDMDVLVVSEETIRGAEKINEGRRARGYAPLVVLVVPVLNSENSGDKLSSTALRAAEMRETRV